MDSKLYAQLERVLLTRGLKKQARRIATSMQVPSDQLPTQDLTQYMFLSAQIAMPKLADVGETNNLLVSAARALVSEAKNELLDGRQFSSKWEAAFKDELDKSDLIPQKTTEGTRGTTIAPAGSLTVSGKARPEESQEATTVSGETVLQSKEAIDAMTSSLVCYLEIGQQKGSWARWLYNDDLTDIQAGIEKNIQRLMNTIGVYEEAKKKGKQVMMVEAVKGDDFSLRIHRMSTKDSTPASKQKESNALWNLKNVQMRGEKAKQDLIRRILAQPLVTPAAPAALVELAVQRALQQCMSRKMALDNPRGSRRRFRRRKHRCG